MTKGWDKQEQERQLIAWLEHRLSWGYATIPLTVAYFRKMWRDEFGDESGIPEGLKLYVTKLYKDRREAEYNRTDRWDGADVTTSSP